MCDQKQQAETKVDLLIDALNRLSLILGEKTKNREVNRQARSSVPEK